MNALLLFSPSPQWFAPTCTAALTNALLLFSPSSQCFASIFPHRTYCRCKRFFSHRVTASPSVHRVPRAVRNDLARPRHSAMLKNALLLFSPSPQWFTPTFPHRTYCRRKRFVPIAPPPAHQFIAFLGRFAMTCTAASLSYVDECAASVLAFSRVSPLPPSPQWFASTFPHCTYCRRKRFFPHRAAARPSAHRAPRAVRADFPHRRVVHRFRWGGSQ